MQSSETSGRRGERREFLVLEFAKILLKTGSLRLGSFKAPDGKLSSYFIDLAILPSFANAFTLSLDCLEYCLDEEDWKIDCLSGVPVTGLLLASNLAQRLGKPLIYVSTSSKKPSLRGLLKPGSEVIVIDDVSETGLSIQSTALAIRAAGGIVRNSLTLIDRGEEATSLLEKINVNLCSFTTTRELVQTLKERMAISDEEAEALGSSSSP